jgi:hypothetical protein
MFSKWNMENLFYFHFFTLYLQIWTSSRSFHARRIRVLLWRSMVQRSNPGSPQLLAGGHENLNLWLKMSCGNVDSVTWLIDYSFTEQAVEWNRRFCYLTIYSEIAPPPKRLKKFAELNRESDIVVSTAPAAIPTEQVLTATFRHPIPQKNTTTRAAAVATSPMALRSLNAHTPSSPQP